MGRAKAHLVGLQGRPVGRGESGQHRQIVLFDGRFTGQDQAGRAISDLRAVAGRDQAVGLVESRFQPRQFLDRGIGPHTLVEVVELAPTVEHGDDFAIENAGLVGLVEALVALHGVGIHLFPGDAEAPGHLFGGLSHRHADHRVAQAVEQRNDGTEHGGTQLAEQFQPRRQIPRRPPGSEPFDHRVRQHHRRATHGLDATGQDQLAAALGNRLRGAVQGLHAGSAVAMHREGGHIVATAQAQGNDAADIGLIRSGHGRTVDDLVDGIGFERHAVEQGPCGLDHQIRMLEGARFAPGLEKRRARAIHDVDGPLVVEFSESHGWIPGDGSGRGTVCRIHAQD